MKSTSYSAASEVGLGIFISSDFLGEGAFLCGFGAAPGCGHKLKCIMAHRRKGSGAACAVIRFIWLETRGLVKGC